MRTASFKQFSLIGASIGAALLPFCVWAAAPTLSSTIPADNAINVPSSTVTLKMTFNTAVQGSTGNITLYKSNGSIVQVVTGNSARISGSGGTTLTLTLSGALNTHGQDYYVNIASTAVINSVTAEAYAGITDKTTWNFSTLAANRRQQMEAKRAQYEQNVKELQERLAAGEGGSSEEGSSSGESTAPVDPYRLMNLGRIVRETPEEEAKRKKNLRVNPTANDFGQAVAQANRDERYDRICGRVLSRFANDPKMLARVNERIMKRFGFACEE